MKWPAKSFVISFGFLILERIKVSLKGFANMKRLKCYCIKMTYLIDPKNNIQSTSVMWACFTCHTVKFSLTWCFNSCTSHQVVCMWLWKFFMSLCVSLSGRCKWCKFLSCSTPMLFWCVGNSFARPITPSHYHYSFMPSALFSFLGESSWDT